VLRLDPQARLAFALRTVWSEPGTAPYFISTWLAKVKTWHQFQAARDRWGAPPLNLVYADIKGNIGWAAGARVPVRSNWDGLLPVPGDGRYEWTGYLPGKRLPSRFNPKEGWVATANEMNLPADQQSGLPPISFEWANRSRIDRINAVLASKLKLSLADSMALQNDNHDMLAGRLTAMLTPLAASDSQVSHALNLLKSWDLDETVDSVAATIYQVWVNHLMSMTSELVPESPVRKLIANGSLVAIIDYLQHPDERLAANSGAARDDLLIRSLSAAVEELRHRFGDSMTTWRWGRLHQKAFSPAVASLADPALRARLTLPAVELGGSGDAPHAAGFDPPDFAVVAGASVRIVLDVGEWDRSVTINAPGQSGDASSSHYSDLLRPWAEGRYVPLLYSRAAIEEAAETVISLAPSHDR
jgi:penicillin amidase